LAVVNTVKRNVILASVKAILALASDEQPK